MKSINATKKEKLSELLVRFYGGGLSYSAFQKLIRKKDILVDGKRVKSDIMLVGGEEILVYFDGAKQKFDIIYSDDNVLVVVKPKKITSEAFFDRLKQEYNELYFCHRLDTNTDDIMLFAKNSQAEAEILDGFKNKSFEKLYLAEVYLFPKKDSDTLVGYLVKNSETGTVKIYDSPIKGAKKVITEYTVIQKREKSSLLKVRILTGKTHQIRAQLAHMGNFVLGDGKYGSQKINRQLKASSQHLTSFSLTLHFSTDAKLSYLEGKCFCLKQTAF